MNYLPGRKRYWVIAPKADADFAAGLEIVLDAYARPPGPARPLVCLDETSKQLTRETRTPLPHGPGREARVDYEYERAGRTFPRYNLIEIFERLNLITVCVFH